VGADRAVSTRFAQSLRERRFELGWTQARLAAAVGARISDVTSWERGESLPPASTLLAVARAIGVGAETACTWLEEVGEAPPADVGEVRVRLVPEHAPPDPFAPLGASPWGRLAEPVPADMWPTDGGSGVVFPTFAPAVVYSANPLSPRGRRSDVGRMVRTATALAALAAALWWAVGQLGSGLSAVFDLFGGPTPTGT